MRIGTSVVLASLFCLSLVGIARGDDETIGPNGISSDGLGLDGSGVSIGMVEESRVAEPFFDGTGGGLMVPSFTVDPAGVFVGANAAVADQFLGEHAQNVASVIISTDGITPGVAPAASLFSSAIPPPSPTITTASIAAAVATNQIATLNNGVVKAINHSFVIFPGVGYAGDGSNVFSQFLDFSAREHDVLHVYALDAMDFNAPPGQQGSVPGDSFNGIRVGASTTFFGQDVYQISSDFNQPPALAGGRGAVDLLAPGDPVTVIGFAENQGATQGSSFAAPHVTGTAALLHQHANAQITAGTPGFNRSIRDYRG